MADTNVVHQFCARRNHVYGVTPVLHTALFSVRLDILSEHASAGVFPMK